MEIYFVIPGPPQGKARARIVRQGGRVHSYTPEKTAAYENLIRLAFHAAKPQGWQPLSGPVRVAIRACFAPPGTASAKKRAEMLAGRLRPLKKPDADNIAKAVCDALNGLAWRDDSQIVKLLAAKTYREEPRVEVLISEVLHADMDEGDAG